MASFSKLLANRLARTQQPPNAHQDADTLNAFAENSLAATERQTVLAHLAACTDCREVLSLIAPDAPLQKSKYSVQTLAWPLAAAATLLLTFSVLRHKPAPQPVPDVLRSPMAPVAVAPPPPESAPIIIPAPKAKPLRAESKKRAPNPAIAVVLPQAPPEPKLQVTPPSITTQDQIAAPPLITVSPAAPPQYEQNFFESADAVSSIPAQSFHAQALHGIGLTRRRTLWSLDSKQSGVVRVSDDGGISWNNVTLNTSATLLSLAVSGSNVWVGGDQGALFHSTDNGAHFTHIIVSDGVTELKDSITAIEVPSNARNIRIKTPSGIWLSVNEGQTWQKQPR